MKLRKLFTDDTAVSPVIGVILMVAITVILAAVVGAFITGFGESLSDNPPQASFDFDYDPSGGSTAGALTITHDGGDKVNSDRLSLVTSNDTANWTAVNGGTTVDVSAGTSVTLENSTAGWDFDIYSGDTLRITWSSADESESATLGTWNGPDA